VFNWYAAPTFAAMLFFWLLACYVLTRSPRSPVAIAAVAAQVGTAAYLLGHGMQANAPTLEAWRPWARNLQWGATVAPTLWYWVTVLLLRDQEAPSLRRYLRVAGYPLGVVFAAATAALTAGIYLGDGIYRWSATPPAPLAQPAYFRFPVRPGPWYPGVVAFLVGTTVGAAVNLWLGWRLPLDAERCRRFGWLLGSAGLFILGASCLALTVALSLPIWSMWLGHLALAAAMAMMAANVAAYSLVLDVEVIRADLLYFLTSLVVICLVYALVFTLVGPGYSFQLLGLLVVLLIVAILSHALVDVARRALDRLFFRPEVQRLRSNLTAVAQQAALTQDLEPLLEEAQVGIAEVSADHLVRLTHEALRRLDSPAALARCGLIDRLPRTLAAILARRGNANPAVATPLEQARALREVLAAAIERLKPADRGAAGALPYHILREEYLLGTPNKHIMLRHGISEGTFHRHRRQGIAILAQELSKQEDLLARDRVESK
jgi:hypothetical protein